MDSANGRATVSAKPPGGNGTIIVIGRSGYWAWAQTAASPIKQDSAKRRLVVMVSIHSGCVDAVTASVAQYNPTLRDGVEALWLGPRQSKPGLDD
jgi:hypothetical protein